MRANQSVIDTTPRGQATTPQQDSAAPIGIGRPVLIKGGTFVGFRGRIEAIDATGRMLTIAIDVHECITRCEVPIEDLQIVQN